MTKYSHLNREQRYQIESLLKTGHSFSSIADLLGCHKSTISRELKRNMPHGGQGAWIYRADRAQEKTRKRHHFKSKRVTFTSQMKDRLIPWLQNERYSPELISVLGRREDPHFVSHETIYKWLWQMKRSNRNEDRPFKFLYKLLKQSRRHRKRGNHRQSRNILLNRTPIEHRPSIVDKRKRLGDLEVDLIVGKNYQAGLLVIIDRASLKTSITKLATKSAHHVAQQIIHRTRSWKDLIKTITYDNDLAFADHQTVNKAINSRSFFTRPYTSQDKGTVENRIGVIRRFFPKGTDFKNITSQQVKIVEKMINNRPVRKFNYQTPNAVFLQKQNVALIT